MAKRHIFWLLAFVVVVSAVAQTVQYAAKRPANMDPQDDRQEEPAAETPAPTPIPPARPAPQDAATSDLQVQDAAPVEPVPDAPAATEQTTEPASELAPAVPAAEPTMAQVLADIQRLRQEVLKLQQTVDGYSTGMIADLQEENRRLREQLQQVYQSGALQMPTVPTPDGALLQKTLQQPAQTPDANAAPTSDPAPGSAPGPAPKSDKFEFTSVAEWGRTPEDAKALNPPKSSLKGIIGWVTPGASDEQLTELGRKLRQDYKDYDNINIEVFDSEKSAHEFKRGQPVQDRRVLSISRHHESGRDVILLIRGELIKEIPPEAPQS